MYNWFTISREAISITIDDRSIRLCDISHIDYRYVCDRLLGATIAVRSKDTESLDIEVGADDAESLKKLIEEFVLVVER